MIKDPEGFFNVRMDGIAAIQIISTRKDEVVCEKSSRDAADGPYVDGLAVSAAVP